VTDDEQTPRQRLAVLYRQVSIAEAEIARLEAEVEYQRKLHGRIGTEHIRHGDESAYQRHVRKHLPFPEDFGAKPCGCRKAHANYERQRAERARERANLSGQTTIFEALRETAS
jgi:hypothetical protein